MWFYKVTLPSQPLDLALYLAFVLKFSKICFPADHIDNRTLLVVFILAHGTAMFYLIVVFTVSFHQTAQRISNIMNSYQTSCRKWKLIVLSTISFVLKYFSNSYFKSISCTFFQFKRNEPSVKIPNGPA